MIINSGRGARMVAARSAIIVPTFVDIAAAGAGICFAGGEYRKARDACASGRCGARLGCMIEHRREHGRVLAAIMTLPEKVPISKPLTIANALMRGSVAVALTA
jgi:hypothetical protein